MFVFPNWPSETKKRDGTGISLGDKGFWRRKGRRGGDGGDGGDGIGMGMEVKIELELLVKVEVGEDWGRGG